MVPSRCEPNTDHQDCKVELLANDIRKLKRQAEFSEKVVLARLPVNQLISIMFKGYLTIALAAVENNLQLV